MEVEARSHCKSLHSAKQPADAIAEGSYATNDKKCHLRRWKKSQIVSPFGCQVRRYMTCPRAHGTILLQESRMASAFYFLPARLRSGRHLDVESRNAKRRLRSMPLNGRSPWLTLPPAEDIRRLRLPSPPSQGRARQSLSLWPCCLFPTEASGAAGDSCFPLVGPPTRERKARRRGKQCRQAVFNNNVARWETRRVAQHGRSNDG